MRSVIGSILAVISVASAAADVAVVGIFPGKAVLVIDGGTPRTVAVGQTVAGVRLVSVERDAAIIEVDGKKGRVGLGDQPISVAQAETPSSGTREITLIADARGHFTAGGSINGAPVSFLVDTGASSIAMGPSAAVSAGIEYRKGEPGFAGTANGVIPTWRVKLNKVKVGDLTLYNVEGVVLQADMPQVLLGMSFLNRMEMRRDGSTMVLRQRF